MTEKDDGKKKKKGHDRPTPEAPEAETFGTTGPPPPPPPDPEFEP